MTGMRMGILTRYRRGPRAGTGGARAELAKRLIEQSVRERQERERTWMRREEELECDVAEGGLEEDAADGLRKQRSRREVWNLFEQMQNVSVQDFKELKLLGSGSFGNVSLVKCHLDGRVYAMKKLSKKEMLRRGHVARVWIERQVLISSDKDAMCKLHFATQDAEFVYMVMDFHAGGDLLELMLRQDVISENFARFYIAELVVAVDSMHRRGVIHRDIKPDNILFRRDGHLVLTDFGLSKRLAEMDREGQRARARASSSRSKLESSPRAQRQRLDNYAERRRAWRKVAQKSKFSTVGTPNYIAPEVLLHDQYLEDCDWWSVGCVLYEMLVGHPPFSCDDVEKVCQLVVRWRSSLHFPAEVNISESAKSLIRGLLCDSESRLGSHFGAEEIMEHPFFAGVDWDTLRHTTPPFVPELLGECDLRYFEHSVYPEEHDRVEPMDREEAILKEPATDSDQRLSFFSVDSSSSSQTPCPQDLTKRRSMRTDLRVKDVNNDDVQFAGFTYRRPDRSGTSEFFRSRSVNSINPEHEFALSKRPTRPSFSVRRR